MCRMSSRDSTLFCRGMASLLEYCVSSLSPFMDSLQRARKSRYESLWYTDGNTMLLAAVVGAGSSCVSVLSVSLLGVGEKEATSTEALFPASFDRGDRPALDEVAECTSIRWFVTLMICVSAALAVVLLIRFLLIRWMWKHARTESSRLASCTKQCVEVIAVRRALMTCSCTPSSVSSEQLLTVSIIKSVRAINGTGFDSPSVS
mmetsp:Transcript_2045/g.4798  ORF Transcript_2045/g.4798 Transcript_2045/m.4798 type:complete len:204 (-) Transcript_2045:112-723(-)